MIATVVAVEGAVIIVQPADGGPLRRIDTAESRRLFTEFVSSISQGDTP
jgi:hypothetical protein